MIKNKKAFTLLEILIVVVIASLMLWAFGYFMPNNNQKEEQIKFGEMAAAEILNELKSIQLDIIRKTTKQFWSELKTIENIKIYANKSPAAVLKIDISYGKDYGVIEKNLKYKDTNYINTIVWFKTIEKHRIEIDSNNQFNLNNISFFETQSCDINWKDCIPIAKTYFDMAAQTISQYFCSEIEYIIDKWYQCIDPNRKTNLSSSIDLWWGWWWKI